jgi:hypothetical protein
LRDIDPAVTGVSMPCREVLELSPAERLRHMIEVASALSIADHAQRIWRER